MSKILILADASNVHTQKWALYLSDFYKITVLSLLPYDSDKYNIITIPSKSYKARKNNLEYNRAKVLFESILFIRKQLRIIKPDLLHAHFASSYGLMGALSSFKPFIVSVWGYDTLIFPYQSFMNKLLIKFVLGKSKMVLATSKYLAIETQKLTKKSIQITPFGVDVNTFKPLPKKNTRKFIIGITKSLRMNYGFEVLFEAVQKLSVIISDFEVHIIGSGEDEDIIHEMCVRKKIINKVKFFGRIEHEQIPKYIHKFSVAVFPTIGYESFGVSAVEAAACGIPLIVSNLGGLPEIVQDGVNGYTIHPGNSKSLFEKLIFLYQNSDVAKSMGLKGREYIIQNFNWTNNANKMKDIYNRILKVL
jgi:glycosyltransferase involved in cell wall biosynthesis